MKPNPASSMHAATASGPRSIRAPSASSRSAEPERLVAERLPCFATAHPAPAAISAAVVETLKLLRPPPVPAVSSSSPRLLGTCAASARMVRARPASSSTVSPFVLKPIRKPAICVSETSPCMISASTSAVSCALRSRREAIASIAAVRISLGMSLACSTLEEVAQQLLALLGQHRLRMELDSLRWQLAVAQAHQHAVSARGLLQAVGQLRVDHERVVAPHRQGRGEP